MSAPEHNILYVTVPLVIYRQHGGFHLTDEIVERLRAVGWAHVSDVERSGDRWYVRHDRLDELRRDPTLIETVAQIQREIQSFREAQPRPSWQEVSELETRRLDGLGVVDLQIQIEIDEYDGRESVRAFGSAR